MAQKEIMADSIVDSKSPFIPSFGSFDETSSAASEREDFLLVLVSSVSTSTAQGRNQKRALTVIEACGVQPEVLDASDPANALVRDELCEMSGIRGVYPQFFLVQGDRTSFFADFAEVEHMNEEGTLAEWLSMELPIAKTASKTNIVDEGKQHTSSTANHSNSTKTNTTSDNSGSDHSSSNTDDLLNSVSVSKILDSFEKNRSPDRKFHQKLNSNDDEPKAKIVSVRTTPVTPDEWSDPTLLEQYEDEILALDDFLQERDDEGGQRQYPRIQGNRIVEPNQKIKSTKLQNKLGNNNVFDMKNNVDKDLQDRSKNHKSISSESSTATRTTVSPNSSLSRSQSPDRDRLNRNSAFDTIPSTLPSLLQTSPEKNQTNGKDISCVDTVSTRSETEQLLQAEVEELRLRCEKLTAERYRMEGQLKEARQRTQIAEAQSSSEANTVGMIHKSQLQQALSCGYCNETFTSDPSSMFAPILSQTCGHSMCRNCCQKRLSVARRHRDETTMSSSERLRNTISSDLFMCGMGDMSQVYSSPSFDEHQRRVEQCESCPLCHASRAFRPGKMNVNESLCTVLKLVENEVYAV